jgi:nucleoside 2-deoxyribosyltransferase
MGYAVMHKKPIIFYTTNEINSSLDAYHVNFLSKILGSKLINIDGKNIERQLIKKNLLKIDHLKYKQFFHDYICHIKSDQKPNYKKIIKIIENN